MLRWPPLVATSLVDNQVVHPLWAFSVLMLLPVFLVVFNRFVDLQHPNTESSHSGPASFSKGGPVRLTRFVEMSLDTYSAKMNQVIAVGRFEHIGNASIRVERTTK